MTYKEAVKPQAANDNRHNQCDWSYLHTWLDFWLDSQKIPLEHWNYNRAIHYIYELYNRPWLPEKLRVRELLQWLYSEAQSNGFLIRNLTYADLPA